MHWLEKATEITHLSSVLSHHVYKSYSSFSNYSHRKFFINIIFLILIFARRASSENKTVTKKYGMLHKFGNCSSFFSSSSSSFLHRSYSMNTTPGIGVCTVLTLIYQK